MRAAWPATRPAHSVSKFRAYPLNVQPSGSGFLTEITQQIHSFRASGVMSSHFARATGSEMRTFRKSAGKPSIIALGTEPHFAFDPNI